MVDACMGTCVSVHVCGVYVTDVCVVCVCVGGGGGGMREGMHNSKPKNNLYQRPTSVFLESFFMIISLALLPDIDTFSSD